MPFYLFQGSYTSAAMNAMVETPQDREAGARHLIESVGGTMHQFFFCMGDSDVMAIAEMPNDEAMASCALAIGASGAFSAGKTTKLLTSAEGMAAMKGAQDALAGYVPATG